jgi:hypothetical protein
MIFRSVLTEISDGFVCPGKQLFRASKLYVNFQIVWKTNQILNK